MYENISSTLGQCGCFLILGIIMGLGYECLRFFRMLVRHNAVFLFIEDTLFFALCALISFITALAVGIGYFRIYYAAFEAMGVLLYFSTVGRALNAILRGTVKGIKRFFCAIYRKIKPKAVTFFTPVIRKIREQFSKIAENVPKISLYKKRHLKSTSEIVYNSGEDIVVRSEVKSKIYSMHTEGGENGGVIKAKIRKKT